MFSTTFLSDSERKFILDGIDSDIRIDGRARLDYRQFNIDINKDLLPNTNSAARIKLGYENITDVIVGIRLETCPTSIYAPNSGQLSCSVDCNAALISTCSNAEIQQINTSLYRSIERLILESQALTKLIIIPKKLCWLLHIDAVVFDYF